MAFKDSGSQFFDKDSQFTDKKKEAAISAAKDVVEKNSAKDKSSVEEGDKTVHIQVKSNLKADISLETGEALTGTKVFVETTANFVKSSAYFINNANSSDEEDDELLLSKMDDKAATILEYSAQQHRKEARQYRQIEKAAEREIEQIEKDVRSLQETGVQRGAETDFAAHESSDPSKPSPRTSGSESFSSSFNRFVRKEGGDVKFNETQALFSTLEEKFVDQGVANDKQKATEVADTGEPVSKPLQETSVQRGAETDFAAHESSYPSETSTITSESESVSSSFNRFVSKEGGTERTEAKGRENNEIPSDVKFNETQALFSTPKVQFVDQIEKIFRKEQTDYQGNPIFFKATEDADDKQKSIKAMDDKQNATETTDHKQKIVNAEPVSKPVQETSVQKSEKSDFPKNEGNSHSKTSTRTFGSGSESGNSSSNRFVNGSERTEQEEKQRKDAKSKKDKEKKKAASKTAFAKVLKIKKNMQNEGSKMTGEVSGDLIADGAGKLGRTVTGIARPLINIVWGVAALLIVVFIIVFYMVESLFNYNGSMSVWGDEYHLEIEGDGYVYYSLSPQDIDEIIYSLYLTYDNPELGIYNMGYMQEQVLRYALSKVGCTYDQDYHTSLTEDIFDCSSLTYRSYSLVGIDISCLGVYTAAEECRAMDINGKTIADGEEVLPGDLIFYGGTDNQRYKGIYHVGIYVGNGKMVEARGDSYGVIYSDIRTNNIVGIARPYR